MQGLDEFIKLYGNVTVLQIIEVAFACVFMFYIYRQVKEFFQKKTEEQSKRAAAEKLRDEKIKEALDAVHKYPEYRKQSIMIQQKLEAQIAELKSMHKDTTDRLSLMEENLSQMKEDTKRRERNRTRDRLLQIYRYYTNPESNPSHSWTRMEAEAFWELFRDYEEDGGDGYMHSEVQPAMERLTVTEINA